MASQSRNHPGSQETHREHPHAPRTPKNRRAKLLVDAQKADEVASRKKLGRLLPKGEDIRDITIKRLQNQLAKMT